MNKILAIVAAVCCIGNVYGYPSGAPTGQCVAMTPQSPHPAAQTGTSPYQITTSASSGYLPGQTYSVTISKTSSSNTDFKGFLCQVRQVGQTAALGTFAVKDASKAQTIICTSSGGAVTHRNRNTVSQQTFDWTAPSTPLGVGTQVEALCTVVQSRDVLWVQLRSPQFQELAIPMVATTAPPTTLVSTTKAPTAKASTTKAPTAKASTTKAPTAKASTTKAPTAKASTTKAPTAKASTTKAPTAKASTTKAPTAKASTTKVPTAKALTTKAPTTKAPTTKAPTTKAPTMKAPTNKTSAPNFPLDFSGCGSTTLCFRDPSDCTGTGDCKYALIVQYNGTTQRVTFHLVSKAGGFAAVGFSKDSMMGMDDVLGCQRDVNTDRVYGKDCWNPNGRNPNQYDADQTSIVSQEGAYVDGAVACRIVRVLIPSDTSQDYDLSQLYTLLFAMGSSRGGPLEALSKHDTVPIVSDGAVNVTEAQVIGATQEPTTAGDHSSGASTSEPPSAAGSVCPFAFLIVLFLVFLLV